MKKSKKPELMIAGGDWKDTGTIIQSFARAVKTLGGHVTVDPLHEGTDQYSFIISHKPLDQMRGELEKHYKREVGSTGLAKELAEDAIDNAKSRSLNCLIKTLTIINP